jgi:hypothetical protein
MDDALLVGIMKGVSKGGDQFGGFVEGGPVSGQQIFQSDAFDKLTDKVGSTFDLAGFVNRHDARMPELGHAAGFAEKPVDLLITA